MRAGERTRRVPTLLISLILIAGCAPAVAPTTTSAPPSPAAPLPTQAGTATSADPTTSALGDAAEVRNVIVMVGDGMGFNQLDAASLYRDGTSFAQISLKPSAAQVKRYRGSVVPELAGLSSLAVRTTQAGGSYDPAKAWASFDYVRRNPTDSAAASTAMATGVKTYNEGIGVGPDRKSRQNLAELAIAKGRAAGVVTSVPFSHATPAGFSVHQTNRDQFKGIASKQLNSGLTVVMGAGHPWYNDNHAKRTSPQYTYISRSDYDRLAGGRTGFSYLSSKAAFEGLASGDTPKRVFGIARVASTLQQKRSGATDRPNAAARNAVPSLATMTAGALNVLDNDPDGFFVMVEGGAIDWANHNNQTGRMIEETTSFLEAIREVRGWVARNDPGWSRTLLIVTADHESGYLTGPGADPNWTPITGTKGRLPKVSWHQRKHTRSLVPFFAVGAGSELFKAAATRTDPVRGKFLDNTDVWRIVSRLWS